MDPEIDTDRANEKKYTVERIIQFIHSWVVLRKNNPESIRVYLSGIVASLVDKTLIGPTPKAMMFKTAYERNESIKLVIKGHVREYGRSNPAYTRSRIPFRSTWLAYADNSIEAMYAGVTFKGVTDRSMIKDLRNLYILRMKCIFQLGFYCLLRKSEFIPTASSEKECLKWKQITFSDEKKKVIPFWEVAKGQREPHFIQVRIIWSKCDIRGASKIPAIGRIQEQDGATGSVCVVRTLAKYAKLAYQMGMLQNRTQEVFSPESDAERNLKLSPVSDAQMRRVLDAVAKRAKVPASGLVTHSLRVGGATALVNRGASTEALMHQGGWSHKSADLIMHYGQRNAASVDSITRMFNRDVGIQDDDVWMG